jgi:sec-independent protein translocase protein TatB
VAETCPPEAGVLLYAGIADSPLKNPAGKVKFEAGFPQSLSINKWGWQLAPLIPERERMFGIGLPELLIIFAVALIVVGPEKLPELARSLAKGMMELKKTANTLRDSIQEEVRDVKGELKPWEQLPPGQPPADATQAEAAGTESHPEEEATMEEQSKKVILPEEVERDRRSAERAGGNGESV